MLSKTQNIINAYYRVIKEQGEQLPSDEGFDSSGGLDVTDVADPTQEETMPMSSSGEDQYISDLIDAALFEPSSEDANLLTNLQSQMKMKKYKNARQEILPTVLNIIRPSTDANNIRDNLNDIE